MLGIFSLAIFPSALLDYLVFTVVHYSSFPLSLHVFSLIFSSSCTLALSSFAYIRVSFFPVSIIFFFIICTSIFVFPYFLFDHVFSDVFYFFIAFLPLMFCVLCVASRGLSVGNVRAVATLGKCVCLSLADGGRLMVGGTRLTMVGCVVCSGNENIKL